jgi:hypothetical protein
MYYCSIYDCVHLCVHIRVYTQVCDHTCTRTRTKFSNLYAVVLATEGGKKTIGIADRTPRETLEKRLEKMQSNARCLAKGSYLMD